MLLQNFNGNNFQIIQFFETNLLFLTLYITDTIDGKTFFESKVEFGWPTWAKHLGTNGCGTASRGAFRIKNSKWPPDRDHTKNQPSTEREETRLLLKRNGKCRREAVF